MLMPSLPLAVACRRESMNSVEVLSVAAFGHDPSQASKKMIGHGEMSSVSILQSVRQSELRTRVFQRTGIGA